MKAKNPAAATRQGFFWGVFRDRKLQHDFYKFKGPEGPSSAPSRRTPAMDASTWLNRALTSLNSACISERLWFDACGPLNYHEMMEFEWDQTQSDACLEERGFDFAYALHAFFDPDRLVRADRRWE